MSIAKGAATSFNRLYVVLVIAVSWQLLDGASNNVSKLDANNSLLVQS